MFESIIAWLQATPFADWIRYSLWGYAIFEVLHHFSIAIFFGSIIIADLRFLGVGKHLPAIDMNENFLIKATWVGFALILLTGPSLFIAYADDNLKNPFFLSKMVLIGLAGINMLFFKFRVSTGMSSWNIDVSPPMAAKISAGLSIFLWSLTVAAGRFIAYPEVFFH